MSAYSVDIDEQTNIMNISFSNNEKYIMHFTSNYKGYKTPPLSLYKKINMIDTAAPTVFEYIHPLHETFKYGMFNTHGDFKYERPTQFEYDKFCYENNLKNSNAKMYKQMMMREKGTYVNI